MTHRRELKKRLRKLKHQRNLLPNLIDCSSVYGDGYYSESDYRQIDDEIEGLTKQIERIDNNHKEQPKHT